MLLFLNLHVVCVCECKWAATLLWWLLAGGSSGGYPRTCLARGPELALVILVLENGYRSWDGSVNLRAWIVPLGGGLFEHPSSS